MELETELDRLFQTPVGDFVAARNEIARALKAAGDRSAAERVSRLAKPSPVAWAVNQLHYRDPGLLDALREAGTGLRQTQESSGDPDQFASWKHEQREALRAATDRAMALAGEGGLNPGAALKRRLEMTLTLISAAGDAMQPPPGRMSAELEPVGFDALTAAAPPVKPPPRRKAPGPEETARQEQLAAVQAAVDAADAEVRKLEREWKRRQASYERADAEAKDAERRAEEACRARDDAERAASGAKESFEAAQAKLEQARSELDGMPR